MCFHSQIDRNGGTDTFCYGKMAVYYDDMQRFLMDCDIKQMGYDEKQRQTPDINRFRNYENKTGPGHVLAKMVTTEFTDIEKAPLEGLPRYHTVLVERVGGSDFWHSLMELFSVSLTLDVLQITRDDETHLPLLDETDLQNLQIVITDDHPDGPFFDLWSMFSRKPILRASDLHRDDMQEQNIILPLAGGSNPLWQSDWTVHACDQSELLLRFKRRILGFYGLPQATPDAKKPLTLTYVEDADEPRLHGKDKYLDAVQEEFADINIHSVKLEDMSLYDQVLLILNTDVLVGVEGAGLTHSMFLRPGSTIIEIQEPHSEYKGFRNMANILGTQYFGTHGCPDAPVADKDIGSKDDIRMEEERFLDLMSLGIRSMFNKGFHSEDVN